MPRSFFIILSTILESNLIFRFLSVGSSFSKFCSLWEIASLKHKCKLKALLLLTFSRIIQSRPTGWICKGVRPKGNRLQSHPQNLLLATRQTPELAIRIVAKAVTSLHHHKKMQLLINLPETDRLLHSAKWQESLPFNFDFLFYLQKEKSLNCIEC